MYKTLSKIYEEINGLNYKIKDLKIDFNNERGIISSTSRINVYVIQQIFIVINYINILIEVLYT